MATGSSRRPGGSSRPHPLVGRGKVDVRQAGGKKLLLKNTATAGMAHTVELQAYENIPAL